MWTDMSDARVLQEISRYLRGILFDSLRGEDELGSKFTVVNAISLGSPVQLADGDLSAASVLLSLYLYQILPNGQLNNQALIPYGNGRMHYPPLSLDLYYLLTPLSKSPEDDLAILGRAMQILAANPILRAGFLGSRLQPHAEEARLMLHPIDSEERSRIWSAFTKPYRMSVCYKLQSVSIDSEREPESGPPVVESLIDVRQVAPSGGGAP
jgi:hypothetical protein